jgi:thiamine kinase-like enzyme
MEMEQLAVLWRKMNSMTSDVGWISRVYGREIGEIYRRFRSNFQVYEEWVLADFRAGEQALDLCLEVFEKSRPYADELAQYDPPLLFCRADPRFANVIRRPDGRLGMVDWEDSGLRDPACDIADMMTHPNQEDLVSSEQWHVFLVNYLGGLRKHDPCIEERIRLYRAMTSVFWLGLLVKALVGRAAGDGFAGWMANDMPAQTRLRRYLARCLAYPDVDFSNQLRDIASLAFFPEPSA